MIKVTHGAKEDPSLELINKELRTALSYLEERNNQLLKNMLLVVEQRDESRQHEAEARKKS